MDLRQEIERVFHGLAWYQSNVGEAVVWHEYDSVRSDVDDVYDRGGKAYTRGVVVPVLWVIVSEAERRRTHEGRKPTDSIALALSARALDYSGITDPDDSHRRLNDLIRYDNRLWSVDSFNIRGRIPTAVVIGVTGTEVFPDEEMSFDALPPGVTIDGTTPTPAHPNARVQEWPEHELPALNGGEIETNALYKNFDTTL